MVIEKIKKPDKKILKKAFSFLQNNSDRRQDEYFEKRFLTKFTLNPHLTLYLARDRGIIMGIAFFTFSKWDTNIFGFKIGKIENLLIKKHHSLGFQFLKEIVNDCRRQHYSHVSCRIGVKDFETIHLLERLKFNIFDVQVTLSTAKDFSNVFIPARPSRKFTIRKAKNKDLVQLKKVLRRAFTDTRFVVDHRFPGRSVDRLYFEWVKNAISDTKRCVFVVQDKKSECLTAFVIADFDTYNKETSGIKIGCIDLIAVSRDCRNQGIGRELVGFTLDWFKGKVDRVEIRTQVSNIPAIKAFMRGGFVEFTHGITLPAGITMHRWNFQEKLK